MVLDLRSLGVGFVNTKEYCLEERVLTNTKEIYREIKIGNCLGHILGGKQYKNDRDQWLEELESISPEIKRKLELRAKPT